jgi:sarcosine oxidase subunit alpha
LLRQATDGEVSGAGEVVQPGCTLDEALDSGRWVGAGEETSVGGGELPAAPEAGYVCLCEDVKAEDLDAAWQDGYRSTELLKRYCKATAGACQGAMCHAHLRAFVQARAPEALETARSNATTARPPARAVRLEDVAAGIRAPVEYRTALHNNHVALGATMEWAGVWKRPSNYGDTTAEYWAVRTGVSLMDVGTLGKYRVAGPDAVEFLERMYPCRVADLKPGVLRYALLLNESGYVFDDGLIGSLGDGGYYLTLTTGGADHAEAWFRDWAESWRLNVHIANVTGTLGAINVAGPRARELLTRVTDAPLDAASFGYSRIRQIEVAGIPCFALRVGFLGELSFELHHPALQSVQLWNALSDAGADLGVRPHGLDALRLLRLEKGHIIIGQDTDFDATPHKLGLPWAVKMDKPNFIGKMALQRLGQDPSQRTLVQMTFPAENVPLEGAQLMLDGVHAGRVTSCRLSPILGHGVALGWLRRSSKSSEQVVAVMENNKRAEGVVVHGPFYDPEGVRLRA